MLKKYVIHFLFLVFTFNISLSHAEATELTTEGSVYVMSNDLEGNAIISFDRLSDGSLSFKETVSTTGLGGVSGEPLDPLSSQNAMILSENKKWLIAVNAGSNDFSIFSVQDDQLTLVSKVDSRGDFPVSLAMKHNLLYVLNSGGDGNIAGFYFNDFTGEAHFINGSVRALNANGSNPPFFIFSPAQIAFNPTGQFLAVTVKGQDQIALFRISKKGTPSRRPTLNISNGSNPFSFAFTDRGQLLVTETFGGAFLGAPNAGAVSSYNVRRNGTLRVISGSVANAQALTCWLILSPDNSMAFTTNSDSDTITPYRVGRDGSLELVGVHVTTGDNPIDLAMTADSQFLYTLNSETGNISAFSAEQADNETEDLTLTHIADFGEDNLPGRSVAGIVVR